MTRPVRLAIFSPALAGFAALLYWSFVGLPSFGDYRRPYGYVLNRIVVPERHAANVVNATTFDVRGIDTMGEELILFAAVVGVVLLLRGQEKRESDPGDTVANDALRYVGALMVSGGILIGLWLISFGFVTPGGGFQGGVAVAAGALVLYLAAGFRAWSAFGNEKILDPIEAVGAGGYVIVGLAALVSGLPFLTNFLGHGTTGTLLSAGSAPFANWAAGLEVAGANLVLATEFLAEYVVPLGGGRSAS